MCFVTDVRGRWAVKTKLFLASVRLSRQRLEQCVCLSTALRCAGKAGAADGPDGAKAAINRAHSKRWRDGVTAVPSRKIPAIPMFHRESKMFAKLRAPPVNSHQ